MKFSDILKTIGLSNSSSDTDGKFNNTTRGRIMKISDSDVDRIHHGHHQFYYPVQDSYHHSHPLDLGLGAPTGNVYYPLMYNMYGQKGYGSRFSGVNSDGGGHFGYGSHIGGFDHIGTGNYDHGTTRKKSRNSSVMTALTLLSFFFFINTLQNCLRDHIQAMNPTVMVMTAGNARNRVKSFNEVGGRENSENIYVDSLEAGKLLTNIKSEINSLNNTLKEIIRIDTKLQGKKHEENSYLRIN